MIVMRLRDFGICAVVLCATPARAQTITVTNVPSQHYKYSYFPGDCPSGLDIPCGQYPSTNHLERGHTIYKIVEVGDCPPW